MAASSRPEVNPSQQPILFDVGNQRVELIAFHKGE
jgi:hypothetical protein